jgi:RHS repeat-associated protein
MFGANGLVSRSTPSGTTWYAFDERGNVAQRTGSGGGVVSSDLYDAFGNVTRTGGPDVFGFGGQAGYYTDTETGLILCTNRFYDPQQGRFLTRDPIGYGGGINLYGYTANNPVNGMDPDGTDALDNAIMAVSITAGGIDGGIQGGALGGGLGTLVEPGGGTLVGGAAGVYAGAGFGAAIGAGVGGLVIAVRHGIMNMAHGTGGGGAGVEENSSGMPDDFSTKKTNNWSAHFNSEGEARNLAREKLGRDPIEFEPNKFRSQDGKWQYRAKPNDLKNGHIHLEELDPKTGEVKQNVHCRWKPGTGR